MAAAVGCFALSLLLTSTLAYPGFQEQIPNGNNVPHPCKANYRWSGVGHENPNGSGARNKFGLGFDRAGYQWSKTFCQADCDSDGRTNGQELGDPNCVWTPGSIPNRTEDITHPGVCDPYDSDFCKDKNTFVSCEMEEFQCEAIKNKSLVSSIDLTFPEIPIPPTDTNYYCMSFDLPGDQDYHIVANEPVISNHKVLHHMLLYGCDNSNETSILRPTICGMIGASNCMTLIGTWTLGVSGFCYGNKAGFKIGKNGYTKALLQIHYNNPTLAHDLRDSSGIRLHYQPIQPGDADLITLMTGQLFLQLPPGQSRVEEVGTCPTYCTSALMTKPAYVISTMNHMHYLGRAMNVAIYRNGSKFKDISHDDVFSYDSPVLHVLNPPFELLPGDEIRTSCVFNTLTSSRYVYYGEATSEEMCYGFLTMYPKQAMKTDTCLAFGAYSACDLGMGVPMEGCDWVQFLNISNPATAKMMFDVTKSCNLDGFCRPECRDVLNGLKSHPCLKGIANQWITTRMSMTHEGLDFLGRLRSCPVDEACTGQCMNHTCSSQCAAQTCNMTCPKCSPITSKDGSHKVAASSAIIITLCAFVVYA
ncbi:hypothetical protein BsWGS_08885 [Bradybaena similaris]